MVTSIIVSIANNGCIGGNNTLLWEQSEDLKRFKNLTQGNIVIMGQKTYESLPFKPLKNRINIVITDDSDIIFDGCIMAHSIEDSLNKAKEIAGDKIAYIIGGGSIYRQFLTLVDNLYITRINAEIEGDTFFPDIDLTIWEKAFSEKHFKDETNQYDYTYEIYWRIDAPLKGFVVSSGTNIKRD